MFFNSIKTGRNVMIDSWNTGRQHLYPVIFKLHVKPHRLCLARNHQQIRVEDMEVEKYILKGRWDYFLTGTSAASCGCQVIDRKLNESDGFSDINTVTSIIVIDIWLGSNFKICIRCLLFFAQQWRRANKSWYLRPCCQCADTRGKMGKLRASNWTTGTSLKLLSESLCVRLRPACPGGSCNACAPAWKNTDFGGAPWSHSQPEQSHLWSEHLQKPPTTFMWLLPLRFLAPCSRQLLKEGWKHFPLRAVLSSHQSIRNRRENIHCVLKIKMQEMKRQSARTFY